MSGDHATRKVALTRFEYAVPSGSPIKDLDEVREWAWQDYCTRTGTDPNGIRPDGWCVVRARTEIVFAFTVEAEVDVSQWADRYERMKADRDKERATVGRVIDLLARETPTDGGPPLWIAAVHAAIEGTP